MPQSITNMSQVWMDTNTRNSISMSVSTLGYGTNINSKLLDFSVDGDRKFAVDTTGRVINPYKPVFTGYRDVSGAWVSYSSASVWVANVSYLNNGNCYNTSTGLFTCPASGFYRISAGILMGQPNTYAYMYYYKNGSYSTQLTHFNSTTSSVWGTISFSVVVQASTNDTLGVGVATPIGACVYNSAHNHLCIEMV